MIIKNKTYLIGKIIKNYPYKEKFHLERAKQHHYFAL